MSPLTEATEIERSYRYLVVVTALDEPLFRYLRARFLGDTGTRVVLDRRRQAGAPGTFPDVPGPERRRPRQARTLSAGVSVIRLTDGGPAQGPIVHEPAGERKRATMEGIEGLEDRQRVNRWLEESQFLVGRMIPAYLDDRERVRARLESVEQDNERLKIELADARRELADLRADLDIHRTERAKIADSFHAMVEHLAALQRPINDISNRLQAGHPGGVESRA
jgi:hypothetical protein